MTTALAKLKNHELRCVLKSLAARDRDVEVELLLHLAELDRRRVFLEWGYGSLWDFSRRELKWSERTASRRFVVARLYRQFDGIVPYVHRVAFDASDAFVGNVKRLQEILGKQDLNQVMLRASEALLDRVDPIRRHIRRQNRQAVKAKAALKQTITNARALAKVLKHRQPLAVRDAVTAHDSAQCSYMSKDGNRCAERPWLHIDHIRPFAMGGSSTDESNNRVLCAAHNLGRVKQSFDFGKG